MGETNFDENNGLGEPTGAGGTNVATAAGAGGTNVATAVGAGGTKTAWGNQRSYTFRAGRRWGNQPGLKEMKILLRERLGWFPQGLGATPRGNTGGTKNGLGEPTGRHRRVGRHWGNQPGLKEMRVLRRERLGGTKTAWGN